MHFEKGFQGRHVFSHFCVLSLATHPVFHGIETVLGGVEERLVQVPEVVPFDPPCFFRENGVNMAVQRVENDGLQEIIHCPFHF